MDLCPDMMAVAELAESVMKLQGSPGAISLGCARETDKRGRDVRVHRVGHLETDSVHLVQLHLYRRMSLTSSALDSRWTQSKSGRGDIRWSGTFR